MRGVATVLRPFGAPRPVLSMKADESKVSGRDGAPATEPAPDSVPPTPHVPEAYRALFARYAPSVVGYMRRRGLSPEAAEEITQDVMLSVWRKAEHYDVRKAPLRTWVFAIARNRFIDQLRRSARPMPDPSDPCWVETMHEPSGPERQVVEQRREAQLQQALAKLSPEHRAALTSLYIEGRTNAETASELGVPVGTVKSRARRALAALRGQLEEGGVDEL